MYFVASFYCREETDRTNQNMCRMALQTFRIRKRDIHMEKVCISASPVSLYMWIRTFRFFEFVLHQEVQLVDHATLYGTISESADIDKYICLDKEERRRLHLLWNLSK